VENVVRNAIRHTAEGTAVEISLQNSNSQALLCVRDYGPGVPESMVSEIFLPFRRVTNNNHDGAGLGLAIAERAVQVHRGAIRAMNALRGGGLMVEIGIPTVQLTASLPPPDSVSRRSK
jgi:signal transduction histidine kinase